MSRILWTEHLFLGLGFYLSVTLFFKASTIREFANLSICQRTLLFAEYTFPGLILSLFLPIPILCPLLQAPVQQPLLLPFWGQPLERLPQPQHARPNGGPAASAPLLWKCQDAAASAIIRISFLLFLSFSLFPFPFLSLPFVFPFLSFSLLSSLLSVF